MYYFILLSSKSVLKIRNLEPLKYRTVDTFYYLLYPIGHDGFIVTRYTYYGQHSNFIHRYDLTTTIRKVFDVNVCFSKVIVESPRI